MRTDETSEFEIVEVEEVDWNRNYKSIYGIAATALVGVGGYWIALQIGFVESTVHFEKAAVLIKPALAVILLLVAALLFFKSKVITREVNTTQQKVRKNSPDKAPFDAEIEEAATEQTAAGGDGTKPNAVRPQQPPRSNQRDDRGGGKGRGSNGSSQAPHDGKPGSGKPDDKKTPAGA